ncbi:hypothetical protein BgiBS90_033395 [Biomphalaria glabrata]|nr:hypothetical protein BgiBS90_033395 [Biomphalaria glabrata]
MQGEETRRHSHITSLAFLSNVDDYLPIDSETHVRLNNLGCSGAPAQTRYQKTMKAEMENSFAAYYDEADLSNFNIFWEFALKKT